MPKPDALKALRELVDELSTIINESNGVPAGPLYMTFAEAGLTLDQFEQIMGAMVATGKIRKSGHQYFPVKK